MSTVLFFSTPVPRDLPSANLSDKIGPSGLDWSTKTKTSGKFPDSAGENFLTTLKKVSQNRIRQNGPPDAGRSGSLETTKTALSGETDETSNPNADQMELTPLNDEDTGPVQITTDWNLMAFIRMLAEMGCHDANGGSDLPNLTVVNAIDGNELATLEMLIARFQQIQIAPTAELKAGFERLRQFISGAQEAKTLAAIDGNPVQGFSSPQVSNAAQIDQTLKNIIFGAQNPKTEAGVSTGADGSSEKTLEPTLTGTRIVADQVGKPADWVDKATDLTINIRKDGTNQIKANFAVVSQSEIRGDTNANQLTTENRPLDLENNLTTKVPNSIDKADANEKQPKEALSFLRHTQHSDRTEFSNRMPQAADHEKHNGAESMRDNQPIKHGALSGMNPEAQSAKGGIKVELGTGEETSTKVIKTEAGTNENGMLNSPSQNTEKSTETAASSKATETGQSSLRTQTMDQIVRRAFIQLRNGQHEARIDLKPEFLGHIRMQVVSENQQVTVKILAEYGFVKNMIENNAHQLKADLQQHGLEIDKLEVSVSRDSDDSGRPRENLAESKAKQGSGGQNNPEGPAKEKSKDKRQSAQTTDSAVTVDFFA